MTEPEAPTDFIAEAITEAFGDRCPDFADGCACCEAWKQYDSLQSSPPVKAAAVDGEVLKALLADDIVGHIVDNAIVRARALHDYAGRPAWETAVDGAIRETVGLRLAALASQNAVEGEAVAWAKREHLEMGRHQFSTVRHPTPGFDVPLYARPAAADAGVTDEIVKQALDTYRWKVREYARDFDSGEMTGDKWKAKYGTNLHSTGLGERWAMRAALTCALSLAAKREQDNG